MNTNMNYDKALVPDNFNDIVAMMVHRVRKVPLASPYLNDLSVARQRPMKVCYADTLVLLGS